MLFRRRVEQGYWDRLKLWLWPRVSWRRSALYFLKRILRIAGTPYAVAMGVAVGVGVSFTPFLGFHILITFAIAWLLRANMIAGALATSIGNPLTFPFIWASTYQLGRLILGRGSGVSPARLEHELLHRPFGDILPLIKPMAIGSVPIGLVAATLTYLLTYKAVAAYQVARRKRLADRRGGGPGSSGLVEIGGKP